MMRKLGIVALGIAVLIGGAIAWWKTSYPSYSHRYRLTVEVEIEKTIYASSSVIEVNWRRQPQFPGPEVPRWASRISGQAALVDLGSFGLILAALRPVEVARAPRSEGADYLAIKAFNAHQRKPNVSGVPITAEVLRATSAAKGSAVLDRSNQPQLIWLSNTHDPSTARPVAPEDFATLIHPSAKLRRITIEITTDALSADLQQKLPWLAALREQQRGRGIQRMPGQFFLDATRLLGVSS